MSELPQVDDKLISALGNLITTAPAMLKMLCELRDWFEKSSEWWITYPSQGGFDVNAINDLIAKARGEV